MNTINDVAIVKNKAVEHTFFLNFSSSFSKKFERNPFRSGIDRVRSENVAL
jgi:hypothetical protein